MNFNEVDEIKKRGREAIAANVKRSDVGAVANSATAHAFHTSANAHDSATEQQHGLAVSAHEHAADAHRKAGAPDMAKLHESIADHHRGQMDNPPPDNDGDEDDAQAAQNSKEAAEKK